MRTEEYKYFGSVGTKYLLELSDFDYLKKEFIITKDNLGFDLVSKKDKKLSISIGQYETKFDRDISHLKLMIARERVYLPIRLLESVGNEPHEFKNALPTTSDELFELIQEFKHKPLGVTKPEEILNFLKKN